jgi:site-specific DNA-methyltransferase (adenine-specific)
MTDVWEFGRVLGDDRYGHATPKPVEMIERVVKSSSRVGDIVLPPFGGTLPEMVACENLGRRCRAVEISPAYVSVALERMSVAFPDIEIKKL